MSKKFVYNDLQHIDIKTMPAFSNEGIRNRGNIVLWVVDKANCTDLSQYYRYLSEEERGKAARFHFQKDRATYVLGRAILRVLIGAYLDKEAESVQFKYNKYGKPALAEDSWLKFNISHSGDIIILGFIKGCELGVDVEQLKANFEVLELADNHFSQREIKSLRSIRPTDQIRAFYRCWTRKESFIKAQGQGLSFPLDQFSVSLDTDEEAQLTDTNWDQKEKEQWYMHSFIPKTEYIAAVCTQGRVNGIEVREWAFAP